MADRRQHRHQPSRDLVVCIFNANGIKQMKTELNTFLYDHHIDILLVSETHLKPADDFRLRNMVCYRTDRLNRRGGGTAVFLKKELVHNQEALQPLDHIEATAVTVSTRLGAITFAAAYLSPNQPLFETDVRKLTAFTRLIVGADLNAKHPAWHSRVSNPKGRLLLDLEDALAISVYGPHTPTHIPVRSNCQPDVLDVAIFKNIAVQFSLETVHDLASDHDPVVLHLTDVALSVTARSTTTLTDS